MRTGSTGHANHRFKPVAVEDVTRDYAADLACGLSVYAGYCNRSQAWVWSVEGEEALEEGVGSCFEGARASARKAAVKLLNESLKELRRG